MIDLLVSLLVLLILIGLVWWAVPRLIGAFGLPPQIAVPIEVLLVVILVLMVLSWVGVLHGPPYRFRA